MTFALVHQCGSISVKIAWTNALAATRQLDCCELFLVIFHERRAELSYEFRGLECKGFDICDKSL